MAVPLEKLAAVGRNIFPDAHASIRDVCSFPWHRGRDREIDSDVPHSSQALCLSVFGSIAGYGNRRQILHLLLEYAGIETPLSQDVAIIPEFQDSKLLNEKGSANPTNVDALIHSGPAAIAVESKFLEKEFGPCGQAHRRQGRNCSGDFASGSDLKTRLDAPCRLMVPDGRRTPRLYWDLAREYFLPDVITPPKRPCPFRDDAYQLMRNFLTAAMVARANGSSEFGLIVTYVKKSPFSEHIEEALSGFSGLLQDRWRKRVGRITYEVISSILRSEGREELAQFTEAKIEAGLLSGASYIRGIEDRSE